MCICVRVTVCVCVCVCLCVCVYVCSSVQIKQGLKLRIEKSTCMFHLNVEVRLVDDIGL